MASSVDFDLAFALVIGIEGGYTTDPEDSGNWTGGEVGLGECKGTKYGISAASYPEIDIANLTLDDAKAIYRSDYWLPAGCEDMKPRLAFVMFDAAVNNGVSRAVQWLQGAVDVHADGVYGTDTAIALEECATDDAADMDLAREVHAQRIYFMADLETWSNYGLGWSRRLALVPLQAALYWPPPPDPPPVPILDEDIC